MASLSCQSATNVAISQLTVVASCEANYPPGGAVPIPGSRSCGFERRKNYFSIVCGVLSLEDTNTRERQQIESSKEGTLSCEGELENVQ